MGGKEYIFNTKDEFCQYKISQALFELIRDADKDYERIAVVCIGTDAVTGDCYGPLVGLNLSKWSLYDFDLYGTIYQPVHAKNLVDIMNTIDKEKTLVIAVDACLGTVAHVGCVTLSCEPVKPGKGVGIELPPVGDISITGIVNIGGFLPRMVLQCTRLSVVYKMAEITSAAIRLALYKIKKRQSPASAL